MSVLEISRVDRISETYNLAPLFPALDLTGATASVALLTKGTNPTVATVWTAVTLTAGSATVLLAGPDADSTGAVVVPATAELWVKVAVGPQVDAAKIGRVNVAGGGAVLATPTGVPVVSVNGKTGATLSLTAADVGAPTTTDLTAGLATKVNSSTYTAGLAGKQDVSTLGATVAADATVRAAFDARFAPVLSTPPADHVTTPVYINTAPSPPVLMGWVGGEYVEIGSDAADINDGVQKLILGYDPVSGHLYFDPDGPPLDQRVAYRITDAGQLEVYKGADPVEILTRAELDSYVADITADVQANDDTRYLSQAASAGRTQGASLAYVGTVEQRVKGRIGVAFLGDSLTNFWYPNAEMWHNHLCAQSGGYLRHRGKFALGGITLEQIESTYLPSVLALNPAPGACVVMGGTNNISAAGYSQATTAATLDRICTALENAGIKPICGILPPRSDVTSYAQRTRLWNAYVRQYAQSRGFAFIDMFAPLVDPATGNYKTGMGAADGIHPSYDGHLAVAAYNLARPNFLPSLRLVDGTPRLTGAVGDVANLVGDIGLFGTLTGGGGANALYPTGWTGFGNFSLIELITDTAAAGNWVRLHRHISDGSGNAAINPVTPPPVSAGDKVSLACKYRLNYLTADHAVEAGLRISILALDNANTVLATKIIFGATAGTTSGTAYGELVCPTGTTKIKVEARVVGVVNDDASYVDIAQWTVENMTTLSTAGFTTAVDA